MSRPRLLILAGALLLIAAQLLASLPLARARASLEPQGGGSGFTDITPGEFAGTLMLGGFRGLACDLLWMRADSAQQAKRFYESLALYRTISRIQPRFEEIWTYLAWDMAYNIGSDVEDEGEKWSWMQAGLKADAEGCLRNPQSEKLLRHLGWMFNHRGDLFNDEIRATDWSPIVGPLIQQVNNQLRKDPLPAFPSGKGLSSFRIAAIIERACVRLSEAQSKQVFPFEPRAVPLAIECDGDLERNRGDHLRAISVWIEALRAWAEVLPRYQAMSSDPGEETRRLFGLDSWQRNEGRLRRKAAQMAKLLAPDPASGERVAQDLLARRFDQAEAALREPGWKRTAVFGSIRWLDER